jgi:Mrp family chromosome partitioning ATPase
MSISDQAFIRAYHEVVTHGGSATGAPIDVGLGSVVPPPHAKFPPVDEKASQSPSAGANQTKPPHIAGKTHLQVGRSQIGSLSSFVGQGAMSTTIEAGRPALEVDSVRWPQVCDALIARHREKFDVLAAELRAEAEAGRKLTAITGSRRGEGRSTFALCLTRRLATGNEKIALVDADFGNPALAAQLGLSIDRGWEKSLHGEESLWEVMVESVDDRFSFAPLAMDRKISESTPAAFRIASIFTELAEHYDIVLVDAGPLGIDAAGNWLLEAAVGVHNIIVAHDVRLNQAHRLAACCLQLAEAKQRQLGIAELFTPDEAAHQNLPEGS